MMQSPYAQLMVKLAVARHMKKASAQAREQLADAAAHFGPVDDQLLDEAIDGEYEMSTEDMLQRLETKEVSHG